MNGGGLRRLDTTCSADASRRAAGLGLAAAAAALWALGGVTAQVLFTRHHVDPGWLVGVRMACAVAMTASWQLLRRQVRPTPRRLAAVAAAATGVWLLAAGVPGGLHASRADRAGVLLAVISAVAYSFYMLGSARLVRETGARPATAWGLSIGSLPILVIFPPWTAHPSGDPAVVAGRRALPRPGAPPAAVRRRRPDHPRRLAARPGQPGRALTRPPVCCDAGGRRSAPAAW